MNQALINKSIHVILENQSVYGSFPASPSFSQFRYCFLRDAVFTAHAVLVSGHPEAAESFYLWVHDTLLKHKNIVESLKRKTAADLPLSGSDFLPTRYHLDGSIETPEDNPEVPFHFLKWPEVYSLSNMTDSSSNAWPNFQTDGYGAWLWGISEYVKITGNMNLLETCRESIDITLDYLKITWEMPCFDPWEEYGQKRAISTLGSIAGGLIGINRFYRSDAISRWIGQIQDTLQQAAAPEGYLPKHMGSTEIDASALWLLTPYKVFPAEDPLMQRTLLEIENNLLVGGVKRYLSDVYYGGGEWFIMTAWLAWYDCENGRTDRAEKLIAWCEDRVDENGFFSEQSLEHMNHPEYLDLWKKHWRNDPPAPMLWGHAMYLIACHAVSISREC